MMMTTATLDNLKPGSFFLWKDQYAFLVSKQFSAPHTDKVNARVLKVELFVSKGLSPYYIQRGERLSLLLKATEEVVVQYVHPSQLVFCARRELVLRLRELFGLSYKKIGDLFGVSKQFTHSLVKSTPTTYQNPIRRFRANKGLTQAQLATRLGVSTRTVGRWEKQLPNNYDYDSFMKRAEEGQANDVARKSS
jgi:DNA-binding XRE family transcriptional regulator